MVNTNNQHKNSEFKECLYHKCGVTKIIKNIFISPSGELISIWGEVVKVHKATHGWVFTTGSKENRKRYSLHIALASTFLSVTGSVVSFRDMNVFNTDIENLFWSENYSKNITLSNNLLEGLCSIKYYRLDGSLFETNRYGVTPDGVIQNMVTGKILSYTLQPCGGYGVNLGGICVLVHRAVASTFSPKQDNENVLIIKDGNIKNFKSSNLEWGKTKQFSGVTIKDGVFARYIYPDGSGVEFDSLLVNQSGEAQSLVTGKLLKHIFQNKSIYVHHTDDKQYALNLARLLLSTFKYTDNLTKYKVGFKDGNCFYIELSNLYWVV